MSSTERLISRVGQLKVSRLPPKSNQLVLGPRPSAPKKIFKLTYAVSKGTEEIRNVCTNYNINTMQ